MYWMRLCCFPSSVKWILLLMPMTRFRRKEDKVEDMRMDFSLVITRQSD